jgi:ABC-2 type transport system ATP-binding protein
VQTLTNQAFESKVKKNTMEDPMKLEIKNIHKSFSGKKILHDVSFTVTTGKAMGFLGRNGAGKTTTIRALMDVFKADEGHFLIDGKPFDPRKYNIGYLPEERGMYAKEKILNQLVYFAELRGIKKAQAKASAEHWLKRFELDYAKNHKLETLSKGNQQKVQIAQSLIGDPDILIFDEPFSGLDPVNSQVLKDVIREKIEAGKLVIFSSHQMTYVEEFCDEITLIEQGRIILSGNLDEIKNDMGKSKIRLKSANFLNGELKEKLKSISESLDISEDKKSLIIRLSENNNLSNFLNQCLNSGIEIEMISPYQPSLTDIFIQKVGAEHA